MIELGQLERRHEDFARRNCRVVVVSVEGPQDASKTQADFPHLLVLADKGHSLAEAAGWLDPHHAPDGGDTETPTTILVDHHGIVHALYRPRSALVRFSPDEVLEGIDAHMAR